MTEQLFIAGIGITCTVGILAFMRVLLVRRIDYISIFLGSLSLFHGILFLFAIDAEHTGWISVLPELRYYDAYVWLYFGVVIVFSITTFLGGYIRICTNTLHQKPFMQTRLINTRYEIKLAFGGWLLLATSIVSYWLFSQAYGGLVELFYKAFFLRAGMLDYVSNPYSFFGKLGGLAFISSFVFWALILTTKTKKLHLKILLYVLGLIISILFSVYVIYTWFSRSHLVFYLTSFIFSSLAFRYRLRFNKKVILRIVIVFIALLLLYSTASYLTKGVRTQNELFSRLQIDASARLLPIFVLLDSPEYRWFQDIVYIPVYFLPQKLWRNRLISTTASDIMTIKMLGTKKGEGAKGAMVIGIVPYAYLQGGIIGLAIIGFIWGIFLKYIEYLLLSKLPPGFAETVYSYVAFRFVVSSVWGADPQVVIYNHIDIIIGIFAIVFLLRFRLLPNSSSQIRELED